MTKSKTKIGDLFSIRINKQEKKYFQLIAIDFLQLNSDVIRVFEEAYPIDANPDLTKIVSGGVGFYTHCVTKWGLKMNLWEKIGNTDNIGKTDHILFRCTSDSGSKPGEQVMISNNWYTWRIKDKQFTETGTLEGENREAEIGIIVNPYDVIERATTGKFGFFYPDFE